MCLRSPKDFLQSASLCESPRSSFGSLDTRIALLGKSVHPGILSEQCCRIEGQPCA